MQKAINYSEDVNDFLEAGLFTDYSRFMLQAVIDEGEPFLDEFRDEVIARLLNRPVRSLHNGNVSYFFPDNIVRDDHRLVKTRIKSADRVLEKVLSGKPVYDFYGLSVVSKDWDVVDNYVRPWLEDHFETLPDKAKFYRDDLDIPAGYNPENVYGMKPSGYEAEHLVVLYSLGDRGMVPIDIHLQSVDAFFTAEFGKAALSRHLVHDQIAAEKVAKMMGIYNHYDEVLAIRNMRGSDNMDRYDSNDLYQLT
ncbi:MAG: hypothetical protein ABIG89_02530 [Candidatus Woesearchaeota archaeon]